MVLATVAMMGMGFAGDTNAVPSMKSILSGVSSAASKTVSMAEGLAADPLVGTLFLGELKKVMVKTTDKRLKINPGGGWTASTTPLIASSISSNQRLLGIVLNHIQS